MIAESIPNHHYYGHLMRRWWAHPQIMVGGTIYDNKDWHEHLMKDYGLSACINVENEHSDTDKGIKYLDESARAADDGSPRQIMGFHSIFNFVDALLKSRPERNFYVHCQMGGSRSPAYAYAVMRANFGMTGAEAFKAIQDGPLGPDGKHIGDHKPYGWHHYHTVYLDNAELALKTWKRPILAETYTNFGGGFTKRSWVTNNIMLGGAITDMMDWSSLSSKYGLTACINLDGNSDDNKGIANLIERPAPDDGSPRSIESFHSIFNFVDEQLSKNPDSKFYVHCMAGLSRSPAYVYGIMRANFRVPSTLAFKAIRECQDWYGQTPHHTVYLSNAEQALLTWKR